MRGTTPMLVAYQALIDDGHAADFSASLRIEPAQAQALNALVGCED